MTEDEARSWIRESFGVPRETQLQKLAELIVAASESQNLIASSTRDAIWERHIVDSAQLVPLAGAYQGTWLDIGTGAGFPGLVVACLIDQPCVLVEPRKKRAAFLMEAAEALGVSSRTVVHTGRIESLPPQAAAVISARAVAALTDLFTMAKPHATPSTQWVLPKGRSVAEEIATARTSWHGRFVVTPSITQAESAIVVASGVRAR